MKALILAAGLGSRLMPLTQDVPKCMIEFQGKKIIDYIISALRGEGIKDIAIVGGYLIDVLRAYVKTNFNIETVFENQRFNETNMVYTFFCARDFLESAIKDNEDVLVSYADIIYSSKILKKLLHEKADFKIAVDRDWKELWCKRFDDPLSDAETLKVDNGYIIELGKKPTTYKDIQAQYMGLFCFSSLFLKDVLTHYDSLERQILYDGKDFDNMYMTSFLQSLIDCFCNAKAVFINGGWHEIDMKSDLDIALHLE